MPVGASRADLGGGRRAGAATCTPRRARGTTRLRRAPRATAAAARTRRSTRTVAARTTLRLLWQRSPCACRAWSTWRTQPRPRQWRRWRRAAGRAWQRRALSRGLRRAPPPPPRTQRRAAAPGAPARWRGSARAAATARTPCAATLKSRRRRKRQQASQWRPCATRQQASQLQSPPLQPRAPLQTMRFSLRSPHDAAPHPPQLTLALTPRSEPR